MAVPTQPLLWLGGPDQAVRSIALMSDGRIVIAGDFKSYGGVSCGGICRLTSAGILDASFNAGTGPPIQYLQLESNWMAKSMQAAVFTNFNDKPLSRLVRLNGDGSIDDSFDIGKGANNTIRTLVLQPDSAVVIGGDFTEFRGIPRNHIARVHGDDKYILNRVQFNASLYRVLENAGQTTITVKRSGNTDSPNFGWLFDAGWNGQGRNKLCCFFRESAIYRRGNCENFLHHDSQ